MYIEVVKNRNSPSCTLLRESIRCGNKIKKKTLANLTNWPPHVVAGLKMMLANKDACLDSDFKVTRTLPHGHVVAILGVMKNIGLERMLGSKPSLHKKLIEALLVTRIISPSSKLAAFRGMSKETASTTIGHELGLESVSESDVYDSLDWLLTRQTVIENALAEKHLRNGVLVLYDVSSSYFEGKTCPLARFGHNKDGKRGKLQIVYGLLCDTEGRPIAIEVFEGNTSDPSTVSSQIEKLKNRFGLDRVVFVGDRGIITEARITENLSSTGFQWVSALRAPAIKELLKQKLIQPELFDQKNLGEISSPTHPGERLIVCRNPFLAAERTRTRNELLLATEKLLKPIQEAVNRSKRPFKGAARIGARVQKALQKYKVGKHFDIEITETSFEFHRNEEKIKREQALDGFYVIRTNVPKESISTEGAVEAYKSLANVEMAFRSLKTLDLHIRPIYHRLSDRVRAHAFLCLLAYYIVWNMKKALAPILFVDDDKEEAKKLRDNIVTPAKRSSKAVRNHMGWRPQI